MSIKSFHKLFILISNLFLIYFGYWCYNQWSKYQSGEYLIYFIGCVVGCIILIMYNKWFSKEVSGFNV